jgi:peptidoglycan/xylan/chitin deacetylase (PgdA/CDA1 family)
LWRQRGPAREQLLGLARGFATLFRDPGGPSGVPLNQNVRRKSGRGGARLRRQEAPRALILLYHRIASTPTDPWSLNVAPDHFAEHLQLLRSHGCPLSLPQLLQGFQDGDVSEPMIVVTFDDGYADNLYAAKPLLERFAVPATVFVPVGALGDSAEFWWDELDGILLQPGTLPDVLQLSINGRHRAWKLGDAAYYTDNAFARVRSWHAWEDPPGARQALYRSLWELLHQLPASEREQVLDELRAWAGSERIDRPTHRCLSPAEARALGDGALVELGAHTMSHPSLATLTADVQRNEIEQSRSRLMDLLGRSVSAFAYPFGKRSDYNSRTIAIVREAGFASACTSIAGIVQPSSDRFQLPRLHVHDWDGDTFSQQLSACFKG